MTGPRSLDEAGLLDAAAVLDGAHPHGYLVCSPGATPSADTAGWRVEPDLLPGVDVHLHPRTVCSQARGGDGTVVLLGHPVDVAAGITDGHRIARRLVGTWDLGGPDALVREAAGLGGRWTLLAAPRPTADAVDPTAPAELLVVPDTHATQPVFYAVAGPHLALGSTPALVAATLGLDVDEAALALHEELRRRRRGAVTYLPGRRTPYLGLEPLVPNCLLRIRLGQAPSVRHERFWPWRERGESTDLAAVYQAFRERLEAHTGLLAGLGRPALSLTAGDDSRVTAAVAQQALRAADGLAFTYINPRDARSGPAAMADVTGASAVAAQLGLPHRVLRWRRPEPGSTFDVLHRRTYAPLVPSRGAAHAMWADLPRDLIQLQSNGGETGTTFIRHRTQEPLSALRLARMMMTATDGLEDLAEQMYAGYQEHAQMTPERLLGYDHHDLFYWEQRIGRWGWQKFTDGDLGHRILLPFNDRVLLETMLSLPYPQREAKVLYERVLRAEPAARLPVRQGSGGAAVGAPAGGTGAARPEADGQPGVARPGGTGPGSVAAGAAAVARVAALSRRFSGRLPGPAGRLGRRVGGRLEREGLRRVRAGVVDELAWARGYAVLPTSSSGPPPTWEQVVLPGGAATLHVHPGLPHAQVRVDGGGVLVLGEPIDVSAGLVGAAPVAQALAQELADRSGTPAAALAAAEERAAGLSGGWLVLLATSAQTVVLTDPLVSLGMHLLEGGAGLVSHVGLLESSGSGTSAPASTCLGPDHLVVSAGPLGVVPLRAASMAALVDLPEAVRATADQGWTRQNRLARHVELLQDRGPAWLGLTGGEASRELLELLTRTGLPVQTLSWWDRLGGDEDAGRVFAASATAFAHGIPHQVVGLREDLDGSAGEPGRSRREAATVALARTWSHGHGGAGGPRGTGEGGRAGGSPRVDERGDQLRSRPPLGDVLDQALPGDAVLWLASRPRAPRALGAPAGPTAVCCEPLVIDRVQGVRPVALPFSDRLLQALPR